MYSVKGQDSCELGHYTCSSSGDKVCLSGWGPPGVCTQATAEQCPFAKLDSSKIIFHPLQFIRMVLK